MADAQEHQQQQQHASEGGGEPSEQAAMAAAAAVAPTTATADQEAKEEEEKAAVPPARAEAGEQSHEPTAAAVAEEPCVTVNLKFIHRDRLSVQCPPTILISELKRKVLEVYSRHVENEDAKDAGEGETATGSLRLIYKGKVMKDDQALALYHFAHDDTIHAVFGRPQTAGSASATDVSSDATSASPAATTGSFATPSATVTPNTTDGATSSTSAGMRDVGNRLVVGRFSFDPDENSPLPDIGNLINSMLSTFAGGSVPEGASTSIRFSTSDSPPLGAPSSSGTGASTAATSPTASSAATSATPSTSTSASSTSSATSSSSTSTPAVSSSAAPVSAPASSSPPSSTPAPFTTVRISTPSPTQTPPSNLAGNATSLLNQAASLRRMIPALELSPLSQPVGLSTEMYSLGNAIREAGDTFLAVHRQLQFVATRFLSENSLDTSERLRLRTRVHQLVSILEQVGSLSRSVSSNLAASSYGPGTAQVPPQSNQAAARQPSTAPTVVRPPTTSVSVSPTVNIFSGGSAPGGGGSNAPNLGNSIADILQVVSSLGSGRTPATATPSSTAVPGATSTTTATAAVSSSSSTAQSVPGSLGSLLNLVSALTSGAGSVQSPMPSTGSSSQGPTAAANQRQASTNAASYPRGNVQTPANPGPEASIIPSIPSRPLSTLFSQVMRDVNTLDEWDPETAEDLLKRIYPHLRHRVRSLFDSAGNTAEQRLKKKWCEYAVEEIETTMRGVLENHAQVYVRDSLRCRTNGVALEYLLEILLDSNAEDLHDQARINAALDMLRKLLRKLCTTVHADIAEQSSPIEAVRIAANVLSSVLTTEDLSIRRSAEGLASRVNREVTSFLKTRTACELPFLIASSLEYAFCLKESKEEDDGNEERGSEGNDSTRWPSPPPPPPVRICPLTPSPLLRALGALCLTCFSPDLSPVCRLSLTKLAFLDLSRCDCVCVAAGVLALLEEDDYVLKAHALQKLHQVVDHYWAEIADAIPLIESLSDDDQFTHKDLAASIASKCFFHLEEYEDALRLALGAGQYFDINSKSQYTDTIIATCIDEYIAIRSKDDEEAEKNMDPRLTAVVERMFERCYASGEFKQALGIALEARRLDQVTECIKRSPDVSAALAYCFEICKSVVAHRDFRLKVYEVMVSLYRSHAPHDYSNVCQCLQMLNNHVEVTKMLNDLIKSNGNDALIAYQVAFDLSENENQTFLLNVHNALPSPPKPEAPAAAAAVPAEDGSTVLAAAAPAVVDTAPPAVPADAPADYWERITKLKLILSGDFLVDLNLDFLYRQSDSDPLIMKTIKTAVENRNSVLHHSAVISHAYMNSGTTNDTFLRENLEWLGKATNWAKFTATASLGVVHKGHVRESMNLLAPYLPQGGVSASPYSEGGALYAMGLIHANKGFSGSQSKPTMEYLKNALKNTTADETVQHGASLGIGLCGLASHDLEIYEDLKTILFTDSAVAGEGAGIAIGLTLLGAGPEFRNGDVLKDLLAYAHDTKHEKIIRGCVMGIALMMYEREEEADAVIEQLIRDKDPLIRYGGIYAIAMAYVGTANNSAIRRLLHVAVSDVSDDVRRASVTCLGFILFRTPVQVPKLVSLLAESFNPHVRYGACIAVGIACAGTAKNEAIQLLEPLLDDAVDYVRQGALMAVAMVIMQESEGRNPKVTAIREKILKLISDKHTTTMTKMGAVLAQGILDAGGRNVVISLQSHMGFTKMASVVGLAVWAQHWFWYPLFNFLELSFQSTYAIGLNKDLKLPKGFTMTCNAKKSMFATPKRMEEKKEEKKELVATAVLSTTAKAKARQAKHDAKDKKPDEKKSSGDVKMEGEEEKKESEEAEAMEVDAEGAAAATEKAAAPKKVTIKEPSTFTFTTPARVTLAQEAVVTFDAKQRYVPILPAQRSAGVIILRDTTPDEKEEVDVVKAPAAAGAENEAEPPEPFEWEPPQQQ